MNRPYTLKREQSVKLMADIDTLPNMGGYMRELRAVEQAEREAKREEYWVGKIMK